jgi:pimeloyl-ACP methyl ester carboxylesterase
MSIDEALLDGHRSFVDQRTRTAEELLSPRLGGKRTVAVLVRPVESVKPVGYVFCHSFGIEQVHLGRVEVMVSRALARSGFPVLRYHGQGYGESEGDVRDITLSSHLADAADAVSLMREQAGVERVGLVGARFGGTVAALVADRSGASDLVMWDPVVDGARYMSSLFRQRALAGIAGQAKDGPSIKDMKQALQTEGWTDLGGLPLSKLAYDEVSGVNLQRDVTGFRGRSLALSVTANGEPSPELSALAEHLRSLGGDCTLTAVMDSGGFGRSRLSDGDEGEAKSDSTAELTGKVESPTLSWASLGV